MQEEPSLDSSAAGRLPQGAEVAILDQRGNLIPAEELDEANSLTETWFKVSGDSAEGSTVEGWTPDSRIRVREEADDGTPTGGTVRRKLGADADPLTALYAEPNEDAEVVGQLEASTAVSINELAILEVWYQIEGSDVNGQTVTGWTPSRFVQLFGEEEAENGRIDRGNAGLFTTEFISKMVNDRFFMPALRTTLLLMVIIIPIQFVLAIIMALVIQARLKANSLLLYIFAIPLGVFLNWLWVFVWFSIFTQSGFINSFFQGLGLD